jgi:hypothetical protein
VQGGRAGVGEDRQGQHRDRVEAGGRERDAAHHPGAAEPDDEPRGHAHGQLVDDDPCEAEHAVVERGTRADQGHEQDGRCVVETGLGLEHPGDPAGQRDPAQHGENRGSVGR